MFYVKFPLFRTVFEPGKSDSKSTLVKGFSLDVLYLFGLRYIKYTSQVLKKLHKEKQRRLTKSNSTRPA